MKRINGNAKISDLKLQLTMIKTAVVVTGVTVLGGLSLAVSIPGGIAIGLASVAARIALGGVALAGGGGAGGLGGYFASPLFTKSKQKELHDLEQQGTG